MSEVLRKQKQQHKKRIGTFIQSKDASLVRIADSASLNFIVLDFEHSTTFLETASRFIDTASGLAVKVFVRCSYQDLPFLSRLADHGLDGVIVTDVERQEEVEKIISEVKYPPLGKRGVNLAVPVARYGSEDLQSFMNKQNETLEVWVLAENMALLHNIDAISQVDGLHGIFFGHYDLSVDLQKPGEVHNEVVQDVVKHARKKIDKYNLEIGFFAKDQEAAKAMMDEGVTFRIIGTDWMNLHDLWATYSENK